MADIDDAALNGGEQTPAPVTPAPAEPAPNETARQTVRRAFEQAQTRAAEREEARARPAANSVNQIHENDASGQPDSQTNEGKPALDRTRDQQGRFVRGAGQ